MVFEALKQGYQLTEEGYKRDTAFFQRLAQEYAVHYDGWVASSD